MNHILMILNTNAFIVFTFCHPEPCPELDSPVVSGFHNALVSDAETSLSWRQARVQHDTSLNAFVSVNPAKDSDP